MALSACGDKPLYSVPPLNEQDSKRLACSEFPEIRDVLTAQQKHVFLSGSNGEAVVTDGGHKWVRFDIVNEREAALIRFGDVAARGAHFECYDDLDWLAGVWSDLQAESD